MDTVATAGEACIEGAVPTEAVKPKRVRKAPVKKVTPERVMLQVHRPSRIPSVEAERAMFLGLVEVMRAIPVGSTIDSVPTTGLGMSLARALGSAKVLGHLHSSIRVLVTVPQHTAQWQRPEEQSLLQVLASRSPERLDEAAVRKPDNSTDFVATARAARDRQLVDCGSVLLGFTEGVRQGSTLTTLRMALAASKRLCVVNEQGISTGWMDPKAASEWAASREITPWVTAKVSAPSDDLLALL
jgi:hypothetical protein